MRDLNFRYIRYRDGTEELYDHRSDANEHRNLASDPGYVAVKQRLSAHVPKKNVVPSSIKQGDSDSIGRKVESLRRDGVPKWLGKDPEASTVK